MGRVDLVNHSDVPTWAKISYESHSFRVVARTISGVVQSMTSNRGLFAFLVQVPARQTIELRIPFAPRRVNPDYDRSITITNGRNSSNTLVLSIQARIIDNHQVLLHSVFYQIKVEDPGWSHVDTE